MTLNAAIFAFQVTWLLLAAIALLLHSIYVGRRDILRSGKVTDLLVVTPFLLVFALFFLRRLFGTYDGSSLSRLAGVALTAVGVSLYMVSHLFLGRNWSLSASVKEGDRLVIGGLYRFVRHPMYSSMTLTVLGSGLLIDNYLMIVCTTGVAVVYYARAKKEEQLLRQEFPEFAVYASRVKMFIPFVF